MVLLAVLLLMLLLTVLVAVLLDVFQAIPLVVLLIVLLTVLLMIELPGVWCQGGWPVALVLGVWHFQQCPVGWKAKMHLVPNFQALVGDSACKSNKPW